MLASPCLAHQRLLLITFAGEPIAGRRTAGRIVVLTFDRLDEYATRTAAILLLRYSSSRTNRGANGSSANFRTHEGSRRYSFWQALNYPHATRRALLCDRDSIAAGISATSATTPTMMNVSWNASICALPCRMVARYSSAPAFCC